MPYYRIVSEQGRIDEAAKQKLAVRITDIHLEHAGGLRQFVTVVFEDYGKGGAFKNDKPASPILVGGTIRAGRDNNQKAKMLHDLSDLLKDMTDVTDHDLIVALEDVPAKNAMEGGHVMPEPGEEQEWLEKVSHLFA